MAKAEKQSFESDSTVQVVMVSARELGEQVKGLEIVNSDTQKTAVEFKADIKEKINTIEDRRKFFTKPLGEIVDGINAQAKSYKQPLIDMQSNLDGKLRAYMTLQQEQARKAQEKEQVRMAKAMENDKPFIPKPIPQVDKKIETESGAKVSMVDEWKIRVDDEWEWIKYAVAEGLRDCVSINEGAVKRFAKPYHGTRQFPGITCYNEPIAKTRIG